MKHVVKGLQAALALTLALCLCACSARAAVTEEAFTSAMEELGYSAQALTEEASSQAAENGVLTYLVYANLAGGAMSFGRYESSAAARQAFSTMVSSLDSQDAGEKRKSVDSSTYNRAEYLSDNGTYLAMIRNEDTLIALSDTQEAVEQALEQLGAA